MKLPWPPSVNKYWERNRNGSMRISREGLAFKEAVKLAVGSPDMIDGPVDMWVLAVPPDHRRRDIDNILKALLDSLEGLLYHNDNQIVHLEITKAEPGDGYVEVKCTPHS